MVHILYNPKLLDWSGEELEVIVPISGYVFWPVVFRCSLRRVKSYTGLSLVYLFGLERLRFKFHSRVDLSCFNWHINCIIKLAFQRSLNFKRFGLFVFNSAYIQLLVHVSYRKPFPGTKFLKWHFRAFIF